MSAGTQTDYPAPNIHSSCQNTQTEPQRYRKQRSVYSPQLWQTSKPAAWLPGRDPTYVLLRHRQPPTPTAWLPGCEPPSAPMQLPRGRGRIPPLFSVNSFPLLQRKAPQNQGQNTRIHVNHSALQSVVRPQRVHPQTTEPTVPHLSPFLHTRNHWAESTSLN